MTGKPTEPNKEAASAEVPKLYSRAHMPGTRYWGFSASRRQVQEQFRGRLKREYPGADSAETSVPPAIEQTASSQTGELDEPTRGGVSSPDAHLSVLPAAEPASTQPYALQYVMYPAGTMSDAPVALPPGFEHRPPTLAVFSLNGGVGKTCVAATLARALSALGEKVLLADTAPAGSLPLYFGSREYRPGVVRTFSPFSFSSLGAVRTEDRVPVQVLNLEAERFPRFASGQDWLLGKLMHESRGMNRILVDVSSGGREVKRLLSVQPVILVPILPDEQSIATAESIDSFFKPPGLDESSEQVFFILNRFDRSSALHQQVRQSLLARLGDRLLPLMIRGGSAVGEALADGMTVMDYAPESAIAEDYRALAVWLRRISLHATL